MIATHIVLLAFVCITFLKHVHSTEIECIPLDVLLTQNIGNLGFHRNLNWLLEIVQPNPETLSDNECSFVMQLEMPQGAFVNPDQLGDLQRTESLKTFIEGNVDVELIDHEATNHTVYVFIDSNEENRVSITIPFHLRFQTAQITGGYGKASIPKPILFVRCLHKKRKLCEGASILAPCDHNGQKSCRWNVVKYRSLFETGELLVPVGNLDDHPIVSIVSLAIGCIGCIYILSVLSMSQEKQY
ncbi:hypothetical protein HHI36_008782 [Cryptolaemus montrouzieri]|uniref:Phosphatidylinositol-glycan biosynthesis class X protein n=1 Tax=Cryptolaemus montrouzieri TaxID=559131 RepID=A0ABD2MTZ3_9CUCU